MKLLIAITLLLSLNFLKSQENEEVLTPVNLLFEGMEKADTTLINNAFDKNVKMFTGFVDKNGNNVIKEGSLIEFVTTIANKPQESPKWIEKLHNTSVKVDGNIAQVWTEYTFFVGDKLIHCGVDAFQLIKTNGKWKIIHLMDTRRKTGCEDLLR